MTSAAEELHAAFRRFDANGDGTLSKDELAAIVTRPTGLRPPHTPEQVDILFATIDLDGDGQITYAEFAEAWAIHLAGFVMEHSEWQPAPEPDLLSDGAPKQVLRAASPEFMSWVLEKLGAMGANVTTLTTHDAVHGEGEKWSKQRYESSGFGYGPPGKACIRMLTMAGRTSLFYFVTQHPEGEELRVELRARFGDDWQSRCFGRATHMLSHSWGMPFAGFISALGKVPPGSFIWNDILAINQHGDAGELAKRDMLADLNSIKPVIQHTKRIVLYWDPVDAPSPLKRVWCLYELLALITTPGYELSLGFTASGRKEILQMAEAFALGRKGGDKDKLKQGAEKLEKAIKAIDSKNAQATVPADNSMIKQQIVKELGGHKQFDRKVQDALQATWAGYVAHAELSAAVAKLPGPSEKEQKAWGIGGRKEFVQVLKKHRQRKLPQEPMPCTAKWIDLQGGGVTEKEAGVLAQVVCRAIRLTHVNLKGCLLGERGWCAILHEMRNTSQVTGMIWEHSEDGIGPTREGFEESFRDGLPFIAERLKALKMQEATDLIYVSREWDDVTGAELCEALRYAHKQGGLTNLTQLKLRRNKLGDGFVTSFAALLDEGGLAGVEKLNLGNNAISEHGMRELAAAITRGGLPSCTEINLGENPGSPTPVMHAVQLKALQKQEAAEHVMYLRP